MTATTKSRWSTDQYGNSVRLVGTFSDNQRVDNSTPDWRAELAEYNKERGIRSLMMNRTGVCG